MSGIPYRYQQISDLEPSVYEPVLRLGMSLADTKHKLGVRTSEWVNGAPALEAAVGASAITQDELGHARSLFVVLSQFPEAPAELGTETDLKNRTVYFNPRVLDGLWESWFDVIAANVLIDRALSVVFAATRESQFAPLQQRAAKILQEERFHRIFGDSWLARLAAGDDDRRAHMQASLDRFWSTALVWFGPDDDLASAQLHRAGILTALPGEMRASWLGTVTALFEKHGLTIPSSRAEWSRWDRERRDLAE